MSDLTTVVTLFPEHELIVRRLYARTPEFRTLCEDYGAAFRALERWRADAGKANDFQQLLQEIEMEIKELIAEALEPLRRQHSEDEA